MKNLEARILAIGDSSGDTCLIERADIGIAFEPKCPELERRADTVIAGNIAQILTRIEKSHCGSNKNFAFDH